MVLQCQKNGFSLVELLVAMSILAILMVISFPSFKTTNTTNRLGAETNLVTSILSYARSEAFRRNDYVSVCATNNSTNCTGSDFSTGVIVYSNPQLAGLSSNDQILKVYDAWQGTDKGKINVSDGGSIFSFNASAGVTSAGTVLVCSPTFSSYTININSIGSLNTIQNSGDGSC